MPWCKTVVFLLMLVLLVTACSSRSGVFIPSSAPSPTSRPLVAPTPSSTLIPLANKEARVGFNVRGWT